MTDGWWSRVWTMQEYILAKDYAFFYNGQHIPSEDLEKAMKWTYFMAHGFQRGLYPAWLNLQPSIFDLKRREQPLDLLDSAILSATRIATDPRDKLYAVLSITSPESLGTPEIRPDYTNRDVGKTYITLAQRLIQGNAGLLSLSLVQHPLSPDRDVRKPLLTILREKRRQKQAEKRLPPPSKPELAPPKEDIFDPNMQVDWEDTGNTSFPSWVPKLMATIAVPPLFLKELEAQRALGQPLYDPSWRIFHAASALDGPLSLSPDGNYLSIQISVIDKIRHTASFEKKEGSVSWPSVDTWWKTVRSWFPRNSRLADVAYYPAPSSSVPTALWRTIIANIWLTTHPALPECYEYFGGFLANARDEEAPVDDIKEDLDLPKKPSRMKGDVFGDVMCHVALERSTFVTQGGYLGLGPERAKAGDRVVLVRGAHMPFVMRKTNSGRYLLVGEAYVHGTMYGELAEMVTFKDAEIA
jgi:hypothetical protein